MFREVKECQHILSKGKTNNYKCGRKIIKNSNFCKLHSQIYENVSDSDKYLEEEEEEEEKIDNTINKKDNYFLSNRLKKKFKKLYNSSSKKNRESNIQQNKIMQYVYEYTKKEEGNIFDFVTCEACKEYIEENSPIVHLGCSCKYHLQCYLIIQNETNCICCNDKILKTDNDYQNCSICLEKIKMDKITTNCNHTFHRKCLEAWNKKKSSCPICRKKINKIEINK